MRITYYPSNIVWFCIVSKQWIFYSNNYNQKIKRQFCDSAISPFWITQSSKIVNALAWTNLFYCVIMSNSERRKCDLALPQNQAKVVFTLFHILPNTTFIHKQKRRKWIKERQWIKRNDDIYFILSPWQKIYYLVGSKTIRKTIKRKQTKNGNLLLL